MNTKNVEDIHPRIIKEILADNKRTSDAEKFLKEIYVSLYRHLKDSLKLYSGAVYFLNFNTFEYNAIYRRDNKEGKIPPKIEVDRNVENLWQVRYSIEEILKTKYFLPIIAQDNFSNRIYGIILFVLDSNITDEDFKEANFLSLALSNLISGLFSIKYKNHINGVISKLYSKSSLIKGFKEKPILYHLFNGIAEIIPFDHSASFLAFNPKKSTLQVYAEKISKANPNYEKYRHLRRYRRYYFDFDKETFENLPTDTKIISLYKKEYLEYFFDWNKVPGKDNRLLIKHLLYDLEINWVKKNAKIEKLDNKKTIVVTNGKNSLSFKLDERKNKLTLEPNYGKTHEYIVEQENKRLNIYGNIGSYEWLNEIFEKCLFCLDLGYKIYLKNGKIDEELKKEFGDNHIFLSRNANISKINEKTWEIKDGKRIYTIEENDKKLKIEKYKNPPIKNILLKQIKMTPKEQESDFSEETSLFGLLILCNYTDSKFSDGDIQVLNYLLGEEKRYPYNESQHLNLLSFIHKTRQSFYGMSSELALKESALRRICDIVEMKDIKEIIKFLEEHVGKYLSLILQSSDRDNNKQSKVKIFFTTTGSELYGSTSAVPNEIIEYFHSDEFSNKIKSSLYEIFHSTEDPEGNEILKKINCNSDEEWKTLTVVKITKSRRIRHLCILRNEYFDISHYDRLLIKFLAEHIGVALFDFSLLEASLETSKKTREYLKETTKLGVADPSKSVEKYFEELLKIAIVHTGSECGNIYTLSKSKEFLELRWQEGKGKKWRELPLNGVGVVPYVAKNYVTYNDDPFVINKINKKALISGNKRRPDIYKSSIEVIQENKDPQIITYISALEGMESEMTLPMCFGKGLWGLLNLESSKANNYDEEKKQILLNIGQRASEIWQQRQLHYALERTGDFLAEITVQPVISDEPDIYEAASKQIGELLDIAIESTSAHSITARFFDVAGENLIRYAQSEKGKLSKVKKISCKKV